MTKTEERKKKAEHLKKYFPYFAESCLQVKTKTGKLEAFRLNKAQLYLHRTLESQKSKMGRVRALILKGRQQGCSTYVEGRFYHLTSMGSGLRAFIICHESKASNNIFNIAKRFHRTMPDILRPATEKSNRHEMVFTNGDCSYQVATAGMTATGRSETVQIFHGSEVAFWPKSEEHRSGVLQTVADANETEIILESTANGMGNLFYEMWVQAEKGLSDYQAIFIPWFWQAEYARPVPANFHINDEEQEYKNLHSLSDEQICWRRHKIIDLNEDKFRQEYPSTPAEAFQTSAKGLLIQPKYIMRARKLKKNIHAMGPRIGGCDPAGDDPDEGDRTAIVIRQGRVILHFESIKGFDSVDVANRCISIITKWKLHKFFVDKVGIGAGVFDIIRRAVGSDMVTGVNAGSRSSDPSKYANLRNEMAGEMAEWFMDEPVVMPDSDEFQRDLMCYPRVYNANSVLKMPNKAWIRKTYLVSPDLGDALGLTFAYPVFIDDFVGLEADVEKYRNEFNPIDLA